MAKKNRIRVENLTRFMIYILGHRPFEFGLVPDQEGFITYKELLWATHEESGWGYVREGHINEVLLGKDRTRFISKGNRIKTLERHWHLDLENPGQSLPGILFLPIRKKAHPHVMEKGLTPTGEGYLVLSSDRDMALRMGRRRDREPVLLEIQAIAAHEQGIPFHSFGGLYLTHEIPARLISGPPLPKEVSRPSGKKEVEKDRTGESLEAGTFRLDMKRDPDLYRKAKSKKRRGWKEDARKSRRGKENS